MCITTCWAIGRRGTSDDLWPGCSRPNWPPAWPRTSATTTCWPGATTTTSNRLAHQLDQRRLLLVPQLDDDVHDLEGLVRIHRYLFSSQAERQRLIDDLVA